MNHQYLHKATWLMRYSPRYWKSFSFTLPCFGHRPQANMSSLRERNLSNQQSHPCFPSLHTIFEATSIVYGQSRKGLHLIVAKWIFVPEGQTAIPYFHAKQAWRGSCVTFCDWDEPIIHQLMPLKAQKLRNPSKKVTEISK